MPPIRENLDLVTDEVQALLDGDPSVSPAFRALIKLMLGFIQRGYVSTYRKQGMTATDETKLAVTGVILDFEAE